MLLTISTTHQPATDLGYLLRKNPARVQSFNQSFGAAHVFYPEATSERCTAALLLEVDPVGLVRNRRGPVGKDVRWSSTSMTVLMWPRHSSVSPSPMSSAVRWPARARSERTLQRLPCR